MADRSFVLNDLLCFLFNKFGKINVKPLKSIISDFYTIDAISEAKVILLDDVSTLLSTGIDKPPHIPRRRDGDSRLSREVDDIFTLINFVDERGLRQKLSHYVTEQPDELPGVHLCDGDMKIFVAWLEKMETRLSTFESSIGAIAASVQSLQTGPPNVRTTVNRQGPHHLPVRPPLLTTDRLSTQVLYTQPTTTTTGFADAGFSVPDPVISSAISGTDITTSDNIHPSSWAAMVAVPNRFEALAIDGESHNVMDNDGWTVAQSKKRLRQNSRQQEQNEPAFVFPPGFGAVTAVGGAGIKPRRRPILIGKQSSHTIRSDPLIKAAKAFPKKSVFYIDNIDRNVFADDLKKFVSDMSVHVVSCFEVEPRKRRSVRDVIDEDNDDDRHAKAFRLCIHQDDCGALLDPTKWPAYVRISEWFFKSRGEQRANTQRVSTPSRDASATQTKSYQETLSRDLHLVSDNGRDVDQQDIMDSTDSTVIVADLSSVNIISVP